MVFLSLAAPNDVEAHSASAGGAAPGDVYDLYNPWDGTHVGWFTNIYNKEKDTISIVYRFMRLFFVGRKESATFGANVAAQYNVSIINIIASVSRKH